MVDNVPTGSGEVSVSPSVLPARVHVSNYEDDKEEDEEYKIKERGNLEVCETHR